MSKKLNVSLVEAKNLILSTYLAMITTGQQMPPICIEGKPGEGKSTIIKQVRDELEKLLGEYVGYKDWRLSLLSSSDLQGIPSLVPTPNGSTTLQWVKDFAIPSTLNTETRPKAIPSDKERKSPFLGLSEKFPRYGLLMLDEINQVEEASMLSLLYNLLLDKHINDLQIAPNWLIVGACNRAEDGGVYNRMPAPVRDRMLILNIEVPPNEKIAYFKNTGMHNILISYIEEKELKGESVLHTYDPALEEDDVELENYIFTTSRSLEMVSNMLKSYEEYNSLKMFDKSIDNKSFKAMICGLMGEDVGTEFYNYYQSKKSTTNLSTIFGENITADSIIKALSIIEWQNGEPIYDLLTQENLTMLDYIKGKSKDNMQILFTSVVSKLDATNPTLTDREFAKALAYLIYIGVISKITYDNIQRALNNKQMPQYISAYITLASETNSMEKFNEYLNSN